MFGIKKNSIKLIKIWNNSEQQIFPQTHADFTGIPKKLCICRYRFTPELAVVQPAFRKWKGLEGITRELQWKKVKLCMIHCC